MRQRWLRRFVETSWASTEARLFHRLLELVCALLDDHQAVTRRSREEVARIQVELVPPFLAASKAWAASGAVFGSETHIAYARAQSWLAWACWSRNADAYAGASRAVYAFHRAWRAAIEAEGLAPTSFPTT